MLNRETVRRFALEESALPYETGKKNTRYDFWQCRRFSLLQVWVASQGMWDTGPDPLGALRILSFPSPCPSGLCASPSGLGWAVHGFPLHREGGGCPPLHAQDPWSPCPWATQG